MTHFKKFTLEISLLQKWRLPTPKSIDFDRFRSISIDFDRFRSNKKNKQKKQEKGGPKARGGRNRSISIETNKKNKKKGGPKARGIEGSIRTPTPPAPLLSQGDFYGILFFKMRHDAEWMSYLFSKCSPSRVLSRYELKGCHSTEMHHTEPRIGGGYASHIYVRQVQKSGTVVEPKTVADQAPRTGVRTS